MAEPTAFGGVSMHTPPGAAATGGTRSKRVKPESGVQFRAMRGILARRVALRVVPSASVSELLPTSMEE
jgi:hypothetical protein